MTFLPIVARELRVASRRRGSYWIRFAAAIAAALLCSWVILLSSRTPQAAGEATFDVLAALLFVYTAVAGVMATCDCLSEEKREGTLGLLFLTDLKGYDVVLGKLAATSVNTLYGLLATIPALAIPLLLGGVSHDAVWRVALVALNLLFFFLALGLFASALCRQDNVSLLFAAFLGLFILLAVPIFFWVRAARGHGPGEPLWLALSPAAGCFAAFADFSRIPFATAMFWLTTGLTQIYGWIFFLLACLITPRSWQERAAGRKRWRDLWMPGAEDRGAQTRESLLEANPFLWRCARQPLKRGLVWGGLALCVGAWYGLRKALRDEETDALSNLLLLVSFNFALKCWIALESPRALFEDRRGGGLELLLSTPLSASSIVAGQRLALWRQFGPPIAAVLAAHLWFLLKPAQISSVEDWHQYIGVVVTLAISLVADSLGLSWWGMWLGLRGRRPNRAAMLSFAGILLLPVSVFLVVYITYEFGGGRENWWLFFWLWTGCGLAADVYFTLRAQSNLDARFSELVAGSGLERRKVAEA